MAGRRLVQAPHVTECVEQAAIAVDENGVEIGDENELRVSMTLVNVGAQEVEISYGELRAWGDGLPLPVDAVGEEEHFIGRMYARTAPGTVTELRVVELT